ncbi:MAG: DUF2752 domain-containing protein [Phycisphaerales bacterium]|nr:DUF2752 domain-containing protein [Phycisphaerales bacterium]
MRERGLTAGPLLAMGLWALLVLEAIAVERATGRAVPTCMFKRVTGYPCATCGSTRATMLLARGEVAGAAAMNPLFVGALVIAVVVVVWRVLRGPRSASSRWRWSGPWGVAVLLLAVGANWAYVLWRGN